MPWQPIVITPIFRNEKADFLKEITRHALDIALQKIYSPSSIQRLQKSRNTYSNNIQKEGMCVRLINRATSREKKQSAVCPAKDSLCSVVEPTP